MAWFVECLNKQIANILKLHNYVDLEKNIHYKVEKRNDKQPLSSTTGNPKARATRQIIVNCFKCLRVRHIVSQHTNQGAVIIRDDGNVISDHENNRE